MKFIVIIICVLTLMLSLFLPAAESCSSFFGIRRKPFLVQDGKRVRIVEEKVFTGSEDPTTTEISISDPPTTDKEVSMKIEVKIYESDNDEDSGDNLTDTAADEDIDESETTEAEVTVAPETDPVEVVVEDKDSEIVIEVEDLMMEDEGEDPVTEVEGEDEVNIDYVEDPTTEGEREDPVTEIEFEDPVTDVDVEDPVTEIEFTAPSNEIDPTAPTTTIEETSVPKDPETTLPADHNLLKNRYEHITNCDDYFQDSFCLNGGTCYIHYYRLEGYIYHCECISDFVGHRCEYKALSRSYGNGLKRSKRSIRGLNEMRKNRRDGFKKFSFGQQF